VARENSPESIRRSIDEAHPGKSLWRSELIRLFGKVGLALRFNITVEGHGNLPTSGPCLVLAKHQRYVDVPLGLQALVHILHERKHDIWCVMKDNLVGGVFGDFFLRCGGIPLNRNNPEKSKEQLLFARNRLHEGRIVVVFPEQTLYPWKMGRGRPAGFRFITGKPPGPVAVNCVGFEYTQTSFPRVSVKIRVGPPSYYSAGDDPEHFLHDRMEEIASLSNLKYSFPRPEGRRGREVSDAD
jgi:1-acyl-sn-glycerol-3-phosphate acyltransferase